MSVYGYLTFHDQHRRPKFEITKAETKIGRSENSDIRILFKRIHRDHARLESNRTEDGAIQNTFILTNGDNDTVRINDQPLPDDGSVILKNNDTIVIGRKKFVFHTTKHSEEPKSCENRRPKRRSSVKNYDMFCGIARKAARQSSTRLSNATNRLSQVPIAEPLIRFDESIATTATASKYFTVEDIGSQTDKSTLLDKDLTKFVTVADSVIGTDNELDTTVMLNQPLESTSLKNNDDEVETEQTIGDNLANVTDHNTVDMSDEEDDVQVAQQVVVESLDNGEVEVNDSSKALEERDEMDVFDENTSKPCEEIDQVIPPTDSALDGPANLDDSTVTYLVESHIPDDNMTMESIMKQTDDIPVEDVIANINDDQVLGDEPAQLNDSTETYTLEEPSIMPSKCFSTPVLREKCSTPMMLKSLLKTNNKCSPILSQRKSVTFSRTVEEKRTEYDKRTGTLLSSKISKKLFAPADNIEEEEESAKDDQEDDDEKEMESSPSKGSKLVGSKPNKVVLGSPSRSTLKTYSTTPPRASNSINVLVPRRTPRTPTESTFTATPNVSKIDSVPKTPTDDTNVADSKQLKTPLAGNETNVNSSKKLTPSVDVTSHKKLSQPKTPVADCVSNVTEEKKLTQAKTPKANYSANVSGIRKVMRTPVQTPKADNGANVSAIEKLTKPKTPSANYGANVTGVGKMMRTPAQTPKADYESNVSGLKKLVQPKTPAANYGANVTGIGKMMRTPAQTPKADYESNVDGLKQLTQPKTPSANYGANVTGIGKMMRTRAQIPKADYESNVDGLKKLTQPKTPAANYGANVTGIGKMMRTPVQTPKADYESNVDGLKKLTQPKTPAANYGANVTGIGKMMRTPAQTPKADYESNVDCLKQLTQPKTPLANYGANVTGIGKMMRSPVQTPKADYESNVDFGLKKLIEPSTPSADYESNVEGIEDLMKTPAKIPEADLESNGDGVKELVHSSTPVADYESNVFGIKRMLATPSKSPKADYDTNVEGVKKLVQPGTPAADYETNVFGLKNLMRSPTKSPKADYDSNVEGVKKLVQPSTPVANYETNLFGIKKMLATPSKSPKADYVTNVEGVKKLVQPGTPVANYEDNVFGLKNLMRTPHNSPAADYISNVAGVKKLTQPTTPSADYEENLFGIKKVFRTPTIVPMPDYESNLDGIGKMMHTPERSPIADYESNVAGVKRLIDPSTPDADYDLNVSTLGTLFDAIENENDDDSNYLTPIKRVPTHMTRRARRMLETPVTEKVEESKPEASKPTRGRGRKKVKEESSETKEEAPSTTRKTTRRRKVPLDELAELCFDEKDEPKKKEAIDVVKNMTEKEKTGKTRTTSRTTRVSRKKKAESELESKLENMDLNNLDSDEMLEVISEAKSLRSTRKRKAEVVVAETPESKPKRGATSRRKAAKKSTDEATELDTTKSVADEEEEARPVTKSRRKATKKTTEATLELDSTKSVDEEEESNRPVAPKVAASKRITFKRAFKVQLPQVDVSMKLTRRNIHEEEQDFNNLEHELEEESSRITTRSRRR